MDIDTCTRTQNAAGARFIAPAQQNVGGRLIAPAGSSEARCQSLYPEGDAFANADARRSRHGRDQSRPYVSPHGRDQARPYVSPHGREQARPYVSPRGRDSSRPYNGLISLLVYVAKLRHWSLRPMADKSVLGAINRPLRVIHRAFACFSLILLLALLSACSLPGGNSAPAKTTSASKALPGNNGTITYSTSPQDVLIRTFRGGGNFGTLEISPEVSIYGDGSYILGPGYQMQAGQLSADKLQQLLHTLVDSDGLLSMNRQQFSDTPDQNVTLLELSLNGKHYEYVYGTFGTLSNTETQQEMAEYHRLDAALTAITSALTGPTHSYSSKEMALLVHQDFSADPTQNIPTWTYSAFTLAQAATYECGTIPADETGPNADTGCLTYTIPHNAVLLTAAQQRAISGLLKNQHGVFLEQGLYYDVDLRYLQPDELPSQTLAMFGSQQFTYTGVPLKSGPIPQITPTP